MTTAFRATLRTAAAALTLAAAALPAAAQQYTLKVTGAAGGNQSTTVTTNTINVGGTTYYTGRTITATSSPFAATISPSLAKSSAFNVYCVDVFNYFSYGDSWTVNATSLATAGALTTTRYTDADALTRYKMAGWLSTKFTPANTADYDDLQVAMWSVMYSQVPAINAGGLPVIGGTYSAATTNYINQAIAASKAGFAGVSFDNAYVLTDASVAGNMTASRFFSGKQEFVTGVQVVPEPSSVALLGGGLLALGGAVRRRRQPAGA